jgi:diguanylate cyclase (GGDEF)-like protein
MQYSPYALPSFISAVVMLILFIYVIAFRRRSIGAWQFLGIMVACIFWAFGYAMSITLVDVNWKIFFYNVAQFGPDFSPIFWLFLILEHTGRKHILQKKWIYTVLILPVVTTILMWTNNWHHLLRKAVTVNHFNAGTSYISTERGPWYIVESVYAYIIIAVGFFFLIQFIKWSSSRKQTGILLSAFLLPIVFNLLDLFNINPLKPFGATSICFTITGLILAWGLFREKLLDITPIARNKVLENIGDGVIVLDAYNRIVDINPAAQQIFVGEDQSVVFTGKHISEFIPGWPECDPGSKAEKKLQMTLGFDQENKVFSVKLSCLFNPSGELMGWVALFHDISEEMQTNNRLQDQLEEINQLHDQLREQALRDPLTNCFNRRYLDETLARESSRADRDDHKVGLVMLDIDHFKQVNDKYGHQMGDQVLRAIGKLLQEKVRFGDIVCRYGGEEFLVVFPGISLNALNERAQMICRQISSLIVSSPAGDGISVTVSAGVALYPEHGEDIEEVLNHADEALYDAKRAGRNAVKMWQESEVIRF